MISIRTAGRELAEMVSLGILVAEGPGGKHTGYVMAE